MAGDGCIDVEEFTSVCSSFGVGADEGRRAFETLSKVRHFGLGECATTNENSLFQKGKVIIDIDYYGTLWTEYFFSDSPDALGNCIFGKTSF